MTENPKPGRGRLVTLAGVAIAIAVVVAYGNYAIRNQYPVNFEFYPPAIGVAVRPVKELANCTTAPWYGALDSADFYAMALPNGSVLEPSRGFPKKLDYQYDWTMVEWKGGPATPGDRPVLTEGIKFAIHWLQENGCSAPRLVSMASIIERPDIRFAYAQNNDLGYVNRFALYIIDPKESIFYLLRFGI